MLGTVVVFPTNDPGGAITPRHPGRSRKGDICTLKNRIAVIVLAMALCLDLTCPALASGQTFRDVPPSYWAYDAIEAANADGVMTGTGARQFSPDQELTIAEFATIIARAFYADELDTSTSTGEWYEPYMDVFYSHELMGEDTWYYEPEDPVYRVDMAIIMRFVLLDKGVADPSEAELEEAREMIPDPDFDFSGDYERSIVVCYSRGLLTGVDSIGTFDAYGTVTRS